MNNISIIDHAKALQIVQRADELVQAHQVRTGELTSAVGLILSAIAIAADNVAQDFTSVTFTIDYTGYGIRYDVSDLTADDVIDNIYRGLDVMEETLDEED